MASEACLRCIRISVRGHMTLVPMNHELEQLQKAVGGWIEAVNLKPPLRGVGIINEEGKLHRLPLNQIATVISDLMSDDYIAGPMIVFGAADAEGDLTSVDDDLVAAIEQMTANRIVR